MQGALVGRPVGDMPHNWASAECVLFLRHMLALEDGDALRLLEAVADYELAPGEPYQLESSPTRFGRLDLRLEPRTGGREWRLTFRRGPGPAPGLVQLPRRLGARMEFAEARGARTTAQGEVVHIDPAASQWEVVWRRPL